MPRCFGDGDPLYERYHDEEWGVPVFGEAAIFERLTLEAFQSGLSWITVLRKRPAFLEVFGNFDPEYVSSFTVTDIDRLLQDERIIRNRAKIEATINNARTTRALRELPTPPKWLPEPQANLWKENEIVTLDKLFWSFQPQRDAAMSPRGQQNGAAVALPQSRPATSADIPSTSREAIQLAKTLKKLGYKFIGPTTAYAAMQATGLVNDHPLTCTTITNP